MYTFQAYSYQQKYFKKYSVLQTEIIYCFLFSKLKRDSAKVQKESKMCTLQVQINSKNFHLSSDTETSLSLKVSKYRWQISRSVLLLLLLLMLLLFIVVSWIFKNRCNLNRNYFKWGLKTPSFNGKGVIWMKDVVHFR